MSAEDMQKTVDKLRTVELHRAVRGVDPDQVRKLLDEAADVLAAAGREQKELRRELERPREGNDEEAVGKALLTATSGEALMAEARETAASITAEAEAQASALLDQVTAQAETREQEIAAAREQLERELTATRDAFAKEHESARAEAEAALAEARRELARLEKQATQLRSAVTDTQRRVVEVAQTALDELETLGASARSTAESDLLAALRPPAAPSDVPAN